MSRQASRDLFDVHLLFKQRELDIPKLRLAFVVYGAMSRKDWRTVSLDDVNYDSRELENQLVPVLREALTDSTDLEKWTDALVSECRQSLSGLLPLNDREMEFLAKINEQGEIAPDLLTADRSMQEKITRHPLLKWKAQNVREYTNRVDR